MSVNQTDNQGHVSIPAGMELVTNLGKYLGVLVALPAEIMLERVGNADIGLKLAVWKYCLTAAVAVYTVTTAFQAAASTTLVRNQDGNEAPQRGAIAYAKRFCHFLNPFSCLNH